MPALVFTLIFFAILFANLVIADRLAPRFRPMGAPTPEDELVSRYQQTTTRYRGRIRVGIAVFFALIAGIGVSSQWRQWILFTNSVDFGIKDPQFDKDVGFYVFRLPFINFMIDWLFAGLVIVLLVTAVAHYLNGGIRFQSPLQRVTPQVKAHLSVLLAVMALVKTADYYFSRFELNLSDRGVVDGASYTDVKAQLPALNFLIFVSIIAAALFIWNIWRRGWVLPVIAVGLWAFVSLVVGTIYPAVIQNLKVNPNEFATERPYIRRNIAATRQAFNLSSIDVKDFNYSQDLQPAVVDANRPTIDNARLWDPTVIRSTYQTLQALQTYYRINDVDVDRYTLDGQTTQVLLSARELNSSELPSQSWVNEHLVYTHGYGAVASPSNKAATDGSPSFVLSDIPPKGEQIALTGRGAEIYFGEGLDGFVIVDAKQKELNYARQGVRDSRTRYRGRDGVDVGQLHPQGRVRPALRRPEHPHLGADDRRVADPHASRHPGAGREARALPRLRRRPVPGDRRREDDLDPRRLHDVDAVPVLAADPGLGRALGRRQLRAQLGEGDRRRVPGHREVLRDRPRRPDHPGVPEGVPRPLHVVRQDAARSSSSTSATRRTCSSSSRTRSRSTTSSSRSASTTATSAGCSRPTRTRP